MYRRFGLMLMVTHACNMRCSYCYAGRKSDLSMPVEFGERAIRRALASLETGGTIELGFFGGEPLLEVSLIARLIDCALREAAAVPAAVELSLTTNGTVRGPEAWRIMTRKDINLAVSFDGLPDVHDRRRRFADGSGTSGDVLATIGGLLDAGKDFHVIMVVGPEDVDLLPERIQFTRELGVPAVHPSLDLWADWSLDDAARLEEAISRAARVWCEGLPGFGVSWFDEKTARLCGFGLNETARCGFGDGEVAVAPSGNLYPCERLIGPDRDDNRMRLPGSITDGEDFLHLPAPPAVCSEACACCSAESLCNAYCRCSNYVRTGDPARPDGLICLWNQACLRETTRVINGLRRCATPAHV